MSAYWGTEDHVTPAIDFDFAEAVTATYAPGKPMDIKRIVLVIKEASNGAETITVAVRNVDDTGSTTIGTFVIPSGATLNSVYKVEIAGVEADPVVPSGEHSQPSDVNIGGRVDGYYTNLPGVIEVNPGQEISLTSTGATATTGQANVYLEYVEQGNNPERFDPTAITFTYA